MCAEAVDDECEVALPELWCDLAGRIDDPSRRPEENGDVLVDDVWSELACLLGAHDEAFDEWSQPPACPGNELLAALMRPDDLGKPPIRRL